MAKPPSIARALNSALRDSPSSARDAAAVALAKRYAVLVDEAEALADALDQVHPGDEAEARTLAGLRARVEAHTVASDLGPKLLAALAALGLTPASRQAIAKGAAPDAGNPAVDALAQLRARRSRAN